MKPLSLNADVAGARRLWISVSETTMLNPNSNLCGTAQNVAIGTRETGKTGCTVTQNIIRTAQALSVSTRPVFLVHRVGIPYAHIPGGKVIGDSYIKTVPEVGWRSRYNVPMLPLPGRMVLKNIT